jgi:CheY-like chemotaxis protein
MTDIKVLIVDDEHDFRETLVKRLERRKFLIQGVENGINALELIEQHPFDVVVLDVMMPIMDGIETLRAIKKTP